MKPRILIVDDEPRMAAAIATALGRNGLDCETAFDAEQALEAFDRRPADVVITDRRMPGIDGIELMRKLHTRRPALPVILITAYAEVSSAVQAMRDGAFDYVAKPFDNDELRSCVLRALELTRLQRENRPKPYQGRNIPIWIGGAVSQTLRRAGELGDGWMGQFVKDDVTARKALED